MMMIIISVDMKLLIMIIHVDSGDDRMISMML